jgi:hypothetical protein
VNEDPIEVLRRLALDKVREQYEHVAAVRQVELDSVNRVRPPSLRYKSVDELLREWSSAANAVSRFAVDLGLITPEQAGQIIREFYAKNSETPLPE